MGALAGILADAQEVADSAAIKFKELAEVAVTAKRMNFIKDGVAAIPEAQEKSVATSGYSLLEIMKLPMLNYNPQTNTVSLQTGEDVKYYINGVSATSEEVDKILPKEVKRVEVMRRPMDPRYEGSTGVVNFVVRQRDSGGYVSASFSPSIIYNKGDGSVFAKYSKGKWSYLAMAGAYYENSDGDSTLRRLRVTTTDGRDVTNNSRWHETSRKQRQYYAGIQAVRTAKNGNQIVLRAGNRSFDDPHMDSEGSTDYDGRKWGYESRQSDSHHSPYVGSRVLVNFANKSTLSVSATVGMTFAKTWSDYESEAGRIENRTDEKAVSPRVSASYMLPIGSRSELSASLSGSANFVRADYRGSVNSDERLTSEDYSAGVRWNYTLSDTWSARVDVSVPVSAITVNGGKRTTDVNADYSISVDGRVGNSHSLSIMSRAWVQGRFLSSYNTLDRVDRPGEGTAGNMDLKPGTIITARYGICGFQATMCS